MTDDGNPATDTDGDRLFEDIDGDGDIDIGDTTTLLAYSDADIVANNAGMSDFSAFSPSNRVAIFDVATHWYEHVYNGG